jgi:hypothetical protein
MEMAVWTDIVKAYGEKYEDEAEPGISAKAGDLAMHENNSPAFRRGVEQGFAAETERCRRIIMSPEAKGREALAKHLAFTTDVSAADAVAILASSPMSPSEAASARAGGAWCDGDAYDVGGAKPWAPIVDKMNAREAKAGEAGPSNSENPPS